MSHTASVEVDVSDVRAFERAAERMGVERFAPDETVRLFDGATVRGMVVKFPEWRYPVVFSDGKAHFDNYNGRWGDAKQLDRFKQLYAVEAAKRKARQRGFAVRERTLKDGTIRLECRGR